MKKTLILVLGIVLGISLQARAGDGPLMRYSVHAGYVRSNMIQTLPDGTSGPLSPAGGIRAGIGVGISPLDWLELGSGLAVIELCSRDKMTYDNVYRSVYAELPLNIKLKQKVAGIEMALYGGGYGALGLGGSTRNEVGRYPFFGPEGIASRADAGLNAGVELTFSGHFRIGAEFRHGLVNVSNGMLANGSRLYNEALVCSISYIF